MLTELLEAWKNKLWNDYNRDGEEWEEEPEDDKWQTKERFM